MTIGHTMLYKNRTPRIEKTRLANLKSIKEKNTSTRSLDTDVLNILNDLNLKKQAAVSLADNLFESLYTSNKSELIWKLQFLSDQINLGLVSQKVNIKNYNDVNFSREKNFDCFCILITQITSFIIGTSIKNSWSKKLMSSYNIYKRSINSKKIEDTEFLQLYMIIKVYINKGYELIPLIDIENKNDKEDVYDIFAVILYYSLKILDKHNVPRKTLFQYNGLLFK